MSLSGGCGGARFRPKKRDLSWASTEMNDQCPVPQVWKWWSIQRSVWWRRGRTCAV